MNSAPLNDAATSRELSSCKIRQRCSVVKPTVALVNTMFNGCIQSRRPVDFHVWTDEQLPVLTIRLNGSVCMAARVTASPKSHTRTRAERERDRDRETDRQRQRETHTHTHTHECARTHTHTHTHSSPSLHTHTHTHSQTHTDTHTHTLRTPPCRQVPDRPTSLQPTKQEERPSLRGSERFGATY